MAATSTFPALSWPTFLLSAAVILLASQHSSLACSPEEGVEYPPTKMEVKVAESPVVVSGVPTRQHDNPDQPTLYGVDFEVYCVFKGDGIGRFIRINRVGHIPGECEGTNLTLTLDYLVYLEPETPGNSHTFQVKFPEDRGDRSYLDEVTYMCQVETRYPQGVTEETASYRCPEKNPFPLDCIAPPTTQAPPEPPKKDPPAPAKNGASYESVVEDNSNSSDDNNNSDGDKDGATSLTTTWILVVASFILCVSQQL